MRMLNELAEHPLMKQIRGSQTTDDEQARVPAPPFSSQCHVKLTPTQLEWLHWLRNYVTMTKDSSRQAYNTPLLRAIISKAVKRQHVICPTETSHDPAHV